VLLAVNYQVLNELEKELEIVGTAKLTSYFGLVVIVKDELADFFVMDNRSWVYQR